MEIKQLLTYDDMDAAVDLQKIYWGDDFESLVPAHMLFSIVKTGGHVLLAVEGENPIGVLIGLFGIEESQLMIASKRMVVLPQYRSQGIGEKLKFKQRDLAISRGIKLVTWTFDPLLSPNAYLNIHKLGCISHSYLANYYGTNPKSSLVTYGSSDRLSVEWWVEDVGVQQRVDGSVVYRTLTDYLQMGAVIMNPTAFADGWAIPSGALQDVESELVLIEVPLHYADILKTHAGLAMQWRDHSRRAFQSVMQKGFYITDFVRGQHEGHDRGFYVLVAAREG